MNTPTSPKLFAAAALAFLMHAAPASAAAVVNYVSATGNDANPCNVQVNPCRTLQRAHNQTFQGGEVRVLSNLPAQVTFINRSLTVNGAGHTLIGPITINNASAIVTIRDLHINGRDASQHGISVAKAAAVHIEKCTTERFVQVGIRVQTSNPVEVFVSDTVSRDNGDGLGVFGNANTRLTVDNSRLENNSRHGLYFAGGSASVSRSVLSGNVDRGFWLEAGTANVTGTIAASNAYGFDVRGPNTEMTIVSSVAHDNFDTQSGMGSGLILGGTGRTARIAHSVFIDNQAYDIFANGTVETLDIDPGAGDLRSNVIGTINGAVTGLAGL
jgi:hypothetical protein